MSSSSSGPLTRLNPNRDTDTAKDILTVLEGDVCGRGRWKSGQTKSPDSTTVEFWHCHHHYHHCHHHHRRGICTHPMSFAGYPCKSFADTRINCGRKKEIQCPHH
ncbi:uncharacterized protein Dsimw501_GD12731 [Drosophila simulans]|uniref:GD12731 n=1 Tax=Drosophila simulans TaxID=7240 RepID=B4QR85_DROSI|nr:GD12731 [Drosophila simulans]KMY99209.1 uncharacterized protein Dsimw501_GD12731 [Drosophila simulans]